MFHKTGAWSFLLTTGVTRGREPCNKSPPPIGSLPRHSRLTKIRNGLWKLNFLSSIWPQRTAGTVASSRGSWRTFSGAWDAANSMASTKSPEFWSSFQSWHSISWLWRVKPMKTLRKFLTFCSARRWWGRRRNFQVCSELTVPSQLSLKAEIAPKVRRNVLNFFNI